MSSGSSDRLLELGADLPLLNRAALMANPYTANDSTSTTKNGLKMTNNGKYQSNRIVKHWKYASRLDYSIEHPKKSLCCKTHLFNVVSLSYKGGEPRPDKVASCKFYEEHMHVKTTNLTLAQS